MAATRRTRTPRVTAYPSYTTWRELMNSLYQETGEETPSSGDTISFSGVYEALTSTGQRSPLGFEHPRPRRSAKTLEKRSKNSPFKGHYKLLKGKK